MTSLRAAAALLLASLLAGAPGAAAQDGGGKGGDDRPPAGGGGAPGKAPNDPKAPLPIRINQAIDAGVAWLRTRQFPVGNWEDEIGGDSSYEGTSGQAYCHPTGCTSLALYALLKSGVPPDDPQIKKAFQWLRGASSATTSTGKKGGKGGKSVSNRVPGGTYEIAALMLALEAKSDPYKRDKDREADARFHLKKGQKLRAGVKLPPEDEVWMKDLAHALRIRLNKGSGWRYGNDAGNGSFYNGPRGNSDMSATQLALLALLAAERCGIQQDEGLYVGLIQWVLARQDGDGMEMARWRPSAPAGEAAPDEVKDRARGWGYLGTSGKGGTDPENVPTGSMTACGLANLLICSSVLETRESRAYTGELAAKCERAWWDGVAWLDSLWSMSNNVNNPSYHYYYMYCVERVGDLKRLNLLAGHPWYDEGARILVVDQAPSGAWTKQDTHRPCDVLNTCFALLFLNRATPAITGGD